jgi:hypothetical protein
MARSRYTVGLDSDTFVVIHCLTNILESVIPDIISSFA